MNTQSQHSAHKSTTIVERCFKTTVPNALGLPDFDQQLERQSGILAAVSDRDQGVVRVRYDVFQLNFSDVQNRLAQLGAPPPTGLWQRWRRGWFVNVDTNIKDNALHVPTCCSRPPAGAGLSKRGNH